ncbi:hypothetical protein [Pseudooceanicola sp. MF1-13]|uniref:hypothetical protein n=1 Tax=Pseudooceanicola sp. MF1-13 TaxID=3379095 RepID=UPI0038920909
MKLMKNIGALVAVMRAAANTAVTAGGAGDATLVTGAILDRQAKAMPLSGVLAIPYAATLAQGETLSIAYVVESGNADDLADAVDLVSATAAVVATGPTGGGTVTGVFEVDLNLSPAGRYVRAKFTPDLSAADTDTAALSAVMVVGGTNEVPV